MNKAQERTGFSAVFFVITIILPLIMIIAQEPFDSALRIAVFWIAVFAVGVIWGLAYFRRQSNLKINGTGFTHSI